MNVNLVINGGFDLPERVGAEVDDWAKTITTIASGNVTYANVNAQLGIIGFEAVFA
jgi:hypothetical protein